MPSTFETLVAVDIGNSRIKLGRFDRSLNLPPAASVSTTTDNAAISIPPDTLELTLSSDGQFDTRLLEGWCDSHLGPSARWAIASVHRGAGELFSKTIASLARRNGWRWPLKQLGNHDIPLVIDVEEPARVGIDRLLACVAADRIRRRDRGAIVVDSGSATTVDLISPQGEFRGGAILPGIRMGAVALHEKTDALPLVTSIDSDPPPPALGRSTIGAIESGLFWGAVGAIRELLRRLSDELDAPSDVYFTGGASARIASLLSESENWHLQYVPHLVLAGIAVVVQGEDTSGAGEDTSG